MLPEKHVFVCIANRPPVVGPSCGGSGSPAVIERLQFAILEHSLMDKVRVNGCTCLGPCESGVNMVVYPEGVMYSKVTPEDVPEIVQSHLIGGTPVERLRSSSQSA
ncbi:MAG: (2Fe-2S) ferredoxin domain-containing protein [Planctomycetes bacterium]|nr:(2Fe-2S) ferredoxin domain-containing protein [Planctomycetota bacterium]